LVGLGGALVALGAKRSWSARVMLVLLGDVVGGVAHGPALEGAGQAVVGHVVDQVPLPYLTPSRRAKCGAAVMFSKPPAMTQLVVAGLDGLGGEHDGLKPEPQTLLMVLAEMRVGQPGLEPGLAGGVLAEAGLEDAAHDALVDHRGLVGGDDHRPTALIA
jgi:hypothetical protein